MIDIVNLPNIPILKTQLPTDIYNSVMSEVKEIEKDGSPNKWNHRLAGAIEREYELIKSRSSLVPFLIDMAKHHPTPHALYFSHAERTLPSEIESEIEYEVYNIWVNFQQKNEYNPIHNHSGDLSFVLWMEIPFKYSDECKVKNVVNSNSSQNASAFQFLYTDVLGDITKFHFYVEKGWEGRMLMFPAKLYHAVNPFQTSDGYRISISGNLGIVKKQIYKKLWN